MAKKKTSKKSTVPAKAAKGGVPAVYDYGEHAGAGYENQTRDDLAMPFLAVLQALSPAVADGTVDGAKPGLLMNTVTQELMDEATFVPACTEHCFIEWVPRKQGGGFVAKHDINSPVVAKAKSEAAKFNELRVGDHELVETFSIYAVLTDDTDAVGYAVLSFESTKIKSYKHFNTRLQTFMLRTDSGKVKPPLFAHHCKVTTEQRKNSEGTWFVPVMGPAEADMVASLLPPDDERYKAAAELRELVQSGTATAAYDSVDRSGGGEEDADKDLPF